MEFSPMHFALLALLLSTVSVSADTAAEPAIVEKGSVQFKPLDQSKVPERYRLEARSFDFEMDRKATLEESGIDIFRVRFPSAVKSPHEVNNTVHCEYYRPKGDGPFPGVVVLDILGGNQTLSRTIASQLARQKIACLFMQMAYYGPRRPKDNSARLLSPNIQQTMEAIKQTVLDVRCSVAWLEARAEIDKKKLCILGTSLGSFMGTLSAEMEPKVSRVAILLGGGGLIDCWYDDPRGESLRKVWEATGGTKEKLKELVAPGDPLTCAANLKDRKVLMICGERDEIVPPKMAKALWEASGKQKIVWYNCTHYGAALYFAAALDHVVKHFTAD
jgi:dienelactone hydrolase